MEIVQDPTKQEVQTSIDIKDDVMTITVNMLKNQVNCYGTLEFAKEMASRYYLTREIQKRKAEAEESQSRVRVILPSGVKLG